MSCLQGDSSRSPMGFGLIRAESILAEMPVMVTLLDLQTGTVVFQNTRSMR